MSERMSRPRRGLAGPGQGRKGRRTKLAPTTLPQGRQNANSEMCGARVTVGPLSVWSQRQHCLRHLELLASPSFSGARMMWRDEVRTCTCGNRFALKA